jgi:hypothetical protein
MAKEIIKGWTLKCSCCGHPLMAGHANAEGEVLNAHYIVYEHKEDAERAAKERGSEVMEVQVAL